jgi:hypothetical protein
MLRAAVRVSRIQGPGDVGAVRAPMALVDRQARHGWVARGRLAAGLLGRVHPGPLEYRGQGGFAEGRGRRGWVGAMAGAQVGE